MLNINLQYPTAGIRFYQGTASVCLWAPLAAKAVLHGPDDSSMELQASEHGYWQLRSASVYPGYRYRFSIDGQEPFPDPASLSQPEGVHKASEAIDISDFKWTDAHWQQPELKDYIIYELHTGTFSSGGDFDGIAAKLDYLVELGITAIELMPVAQFAGSRNWGYDGVYPYAVQDTYGGAKGLQQLVNSCHNKGIAVILDVVYNHLGITGNYLPRSAPYLTDKYQTPWGDAVNFDDEWSDGVRRYIIENALMWFRDFHIDALRLDAVHVIKDFSPVHLLRELRHHTDRLQTFTKKTYYLIAESDLNDTRIIDRPEINGYGIDAQWADEFHHALRVAAGEARCGYYSDFSGVGHLAKAYKSPYVYDGIYSPYRHKTFGNKPGNHQGSCFVVFSQNHDQVGNRPAGERSAQLYSQKMLRLMAAAVFVSPYIPLLFMGEEWAAPHPFLYFTNPGEPDLEKAIYEGRRTTLNILYPGVSFPDPSQEPALLRSKLRWAVAGQKPHTVMLRFYKMLIQLRKQYPALQEPDRQQLYVKADEAAGTLLLCRKAGKQRIACLMNFSEQHRQMALPVDGPEWHRLTDSAGPEWGGSSNTPPTAGDHSIVTVHPESILIYSNSYV